ncbi:histidine--tRNA ligase [Egicoccus halophilus]|uniref:Histidine--tRNA ligase n=1 Tax=Egicoccus halophilus TaxID=1670830 RepID=A0A8J3EV42_9ACTN|nr:histidine--tRNA ligase [Egicoccus halophilus]GGI07325.1 histidine--tRNA ligase [Egicoccus halophilus]
MATIDANPPSGTRDFLPADVSRRERAFATIRRVFGAHGFEPLDTPAFERLEVLTGKYGEEGDQLIFKILRRGEHEATGEADLALRYDLTVPLARVAARYGSQLPMPFKRYHVAPVWRADRPGKGRYREFFQCDVDTVGSDSLVADAATLHAVTDVLDQLGLSGFRVQLNSRKALHGLVEAYGVPEALEGSTLVALDKLDKIGLDRVAGELLERGVPSDAVDALAGDLAATDLVDRVRGRLERTDRGRAGLAEVDRVLELVGTVPGGDIAFAPVLARGLTYYTGPVFEVVHDGLDATIAGGGRYDGLIGMFQGQDVPATGGSLGIERILLLLERQDAGRRSGPDVLVTVLDEDGATDAMALAQRLRGQGFSTDLYVGGGKLGKQLKHADRRAARVALIRGADERAAGTVAVKHLASGEQTTVAEADLADHLARLLAD